MHAWLLGNGIMLAQAAGGEIKPESIQEFNDQLTAPLPGITRDSERRDEEEGESWGALLGAMGGFDDE